MMPTQRNGRSDRPHEHAPGRRLRLVAIAIGVVLVAVSACAPTATTTGPRPSGTIEVAGGLRAVNHLDISLQLSATPGVTEMRISDGSDPTSDAWVDYQASVPWELPATGEGQHIISAQFRSDDGGESAVVTTNLTYDTTPPKVVVSSPSTGATVDVSHGELGVMTGTAVDAGSGTDDVEVIAPDGTPAPADLKGSSDWTGLVSAPTSGTYQFKVVAVDKAGNSATTPISLNVKAMPPTEGTVVRPTTADLTAPQQTAIRQVEADSVTFAGDVRPALAGKTTLISAPVDGKADDGLLRGIDTVTYDAASATTTVGTAEASLPDAFAQFDLTAATAATGTAGTALTPAATPSTSSGVATPSATTDACSSFTAGRTLSYTKTGSWNWSPSGDVLGATASGAISASATLAAYADLDLHLKVGWSPKVTGTVSAGAMACSDIKATTSASFDKTFDLPGPELGACGLVGPIPVCVRSETGLQVKASITGPSASASGNAGFEATYPIGGEPTFNYPRSLNASAQAFGSGDLFIGPSVTLKLVAAEAVETDLMTFSGGPVLTYDSSRHSADACVRVNAGFTPSLKVKLPLTNKSFTLFERSFDKPLTGLCTQVWPHPSSGGDGSNPGNTGGDGGSAPSTPSTLTGKIAREPDGTSWYVDLRNGTHWIPDGGTYQCLAGQGKQVVSAADDQVVKLRNYEDAQCVRANSGDIIRNDDGDAYLLDSGTRRWIADGGTYDCLRLNGHAVVGSVPRYYIDDTPKGADLTWSCWNAANAPGHVVRTDDGSSFYIDLRGGRHWIPDGGTYQCLVAQGRSDYGNVIPRSWLDPVPQYENAQCVNANAGDIIRNNDGDTYVMATGTTRRWIPNGPSYSCEIARGHRLVNGVPRYYIDDLGNAGDLSTSEACRIIVAHTDGDSHFIDANGFRHWIPSTAVYNCLAAKYWRFNTSDRNLINNGWVEKEWATCAM